MSLAKGEINEIENALEEAGALMNRGELDRADELLSLFQKKYPSDSRFLSLTAQIKISQANIKEAKMFAEKAIKLDEENTEPKFMMAFCLQCEGKHSGAVNMYKKIIDKEPNDATAYLFMAESLSSKGKINEAIKAYQKVISINQNGEAAEIAEESIMKLKEEI